MRLKRYVKNKGIENKTSMKGESCQTYQTFSDLSENNVLAVEPRGVNSTDEKLGPIAKIYNITMLETINS